MSRDIFTCPLDISQNIDLGAFMSAVFLQILLKTLKHRHIRRLKTPNASVHERVDDE